MYSNVTRLHGLAEKVIGCKGVKAKAEFLGKPEETDFQNSEVAAFRRKVASLSVSSKTSSPIYHNAMPWGLMSAVVDIN
jgi:hypothetical protein